MNITLSTTQESRRCPVEVSDLIVAGWTGRDLAALEAHIHELETLGVCRPRTTPMFYRVASSLLTTAASVDVIGNDSTGEVEAVLFAWEGSLWVGVGSDHTDRKAETHGITLSKQMCPKPIAPEAWAFADLEDHWDELILRSYATSHGSESLYQEGSVSRMRHPLELIETWSRRTGSEFANGALMFCGTLAVAGEIRAAESFRLELEDPVLNRRIGHVYRIRVLPIEE